MRRIRGFGRRNPQIDVSKGRAQGHQVESSESPEVYPRLPLPVLLDPRRPMLHRFIVP